MSVPYLFQNLTGPISLSELDANFAAVEADITTAVQNIQNGTTQLTTPVLGYATASQIVASYGIYSLGQYAGTYTDGIVMDYVSPFGRFNVGTSDGFVWNNGGTSSTTPLMALSPTGNLWQTCGVHTSISSAATLTVAQIQTDIIYTTGGTYTLTMPTATVLDTGFATMAGITNFNNMGIDFHIINAATGTVTLAIATGVTSYGVLTVGTGVSAHFRLRRVSNNNYVVYRLS